MFNLIKPAGTATLTCYLIPYYFYSFATIITLQLPGFLNNGIIGLIKSMIFAFLIIGITWVLIQQSIKLKI